VVYVGSAESDQHDQELESVLVGPVPVGMNKFVLHTKAPSADNIPITDLLGVTVVLITCSYKDQEFIRVGYVRSVRSGLDIPLTPVCCRSYYVNNSHPDYVDPAEDDDADMEMEEAEEGADTPIAKTKSTFTVTDFSTIKRSILAEKPRVTRFPIDWS